MYHNTHNICKYLVNNGYYDHYFCDEDGKNGLVNIYTLYRKDKLNGDVIIYAYYEDDDPWFVKDLENSVWLIPKVCKPNITDIALGLADIPQEIRDDILAHKPAYNRKTYGLNYIAKANLCQYLALNA